jgi:TolB-like protein/Tfp pilus assembly protein PilF
MESFAELTPHRPNALLTASFARRASRSPLRKLLFSLRIPHGVPMGTARHYEFGPFRLDPVGRLVFRDGQRLALSPKAVELLLALVEAGTNAAGKEELLNKVWPDTAVEEGSLTSHISLLRKTLGEHYIETIPKRGYRFVGTVKRLAEVTERPPQIRSLAVLPLGNLGRDSDEDGFADSMTEALITNLAKIGALRVVSRTSVMRYKNTQKSIPEIGKELGVDALLEGSVQREGDRVRINVRLVGASADEHLWAEAYDRDLRDVLTLQNEVARSVAKEIQVKLTPEEDKRLSRRHRVDPDAYRLYIKGRYFWVKRNEQSFQLAIAYFEQAIERDPSYAAAYSGLADCYSSLGFSFDVGSRRPSDVQPKAKSAALKAIALDDSLAEAHNSLAYVKLNYEWDWAGAEAEFKRSLELNPGYAHAHHWYAHLLLSGGRRKEALAESDRALELDPLSPIMNLHLGWHYLYTREYEQAIEQFAKTLELEGNYGLAYWYRGLAHEQKGMYRDAMGDFRKAKGLLADNLTVQADMGRIHALTGHTDEAEKAIEKLKQKSKKNYVNPYQFALIHIGLGQKEQAFEWLDKALHERSDMLVYLKADFRLDPIRNDSRFIHLGRKVGIPEL